MKITVWFLMFAVMVPLTVRALEFDDWTTQDYVLQGIYTAVTVVDWRQTKKFIANGGKEENIFLGPDPSQERTDTLIGLGIICHVLITYALPQKHRIYWQTIFIVLEIDAINHNYRMGTRISF